MWELDYKEGWALKNWCFQTVVLEKTSESPLDCKEIKPVNPKGNHSWIVIGKTDMKLKLQYFGHLMQITDLLEKTLMLVKFEARWRRGQQRMKWLHDITDSMDMNFSKLWDIVKGILVCCSPWGLKGLYMTAWLNNNKDSTYRKLSLLAKRRWRN